jgi:translation initiation factor 5
LSSYFIDNVHSLPIVEEACNRFTSWFSEESKASSSAEVILEELRSLQTMSSLRSADRAIIFIGATMTENIVAGEEIVKHKKILEALGPSAIQQRHLIAAFEWFCGAKYPSLMGKFPIILKLLYDEEIVEEDIFLMWSADYARNEYSAADSLIDIDTLEQLKENAGPFITWVKEADEEGEDSDEEEEDDEEEA